MEWTQRTYRLDEVTRKFKLPVVIHLTEGYYSATDAEGFSAGDIMTIDSELTLHKVGAFFEKHNSVDRYVNIADQEILIPLNYKGKLNVLQNIKRYESIHELCQDSPRYAKVGQNFSVQTNDGIVIDMRAGTVIELDRLIPGTRGPNPKPDQLVIEFKKQNMPVVVAIPTSTRGKFMTELDQNEYTIKEAIDRYKLPQKIRFIDDEIKRVYTQDLVEGIENMKTITITDTLRLNRLVTQNVLVGHYKPIDSFCLEDTESFRLRTLVVIPLDIPDVREIEVNVLEGLTEDIYSDNFHITNVSRDLELVDGSLYIDFAMHPRITRLESRCGIAVGKQRVGNTPKEELGRESPVSVPPPLPPKPRRRTSTTSEPRQKPPNPPSSDKTDDGYEKPKIISMQANRRKPPPPPSLNDIDDVYENSDLLSKRPTNITSSEPGKTKRKNTETKAFASKTSNFEEEDLGIYAEIDDSKQAKQKARNERVNYEIPPKPVSVRSILTESYSSNKNTKRNGHETKAVMPVAPVINSANKRGDTKNFSDLSVRELVQRLTLCGMKTVAKICEEEHLDGNFVSKLTTKDLTNDPFNLSARHLKEIEKIRTNLHPAL